jgi:hypothetical protein
VFLLKCYSSDKIKRNEMDRSCGTHGEGLHTAFREGEIEGKRKLIRPRRRWENINTGLQVIGWEEH